MIMHWPKARWGGKGFIKVTGNSPFRRGRAGTQDKNLDEGNEVENMKKFFLSHGLLSLISYITQDHPIMGSTTHTLCPPTVINQETLQRYSHKPISWRHYQNWGSFLTGDSNLCQNDRTKKHRQLQPLSLWFYRRGTICHHMSTHFLPCPALPCSVTFTRTTHTCMKQRTLFTSASSIL